MESLPLLQLTWGIVPRYLLNFTMLVLAPWAMTAGGFMVILDKR